MFSAFKLPSKTKQQIDFKNKYIYKATKIAIDVPMEILIQRDTKNLYKKALKNEIDNVVGIQIPFPRPVNADLVLSEWDDDKTPEEIIKIILEKMPKI